MLTHPIKVWDTGSISADSRSNEFHVKHGTNWSVQFDYNKASGNLAGSIELWASNRKEPAGGASADTDWVKVIGWAISPAPAGVADKAFQDVGNASAFRYRFKFVRTSGTGTIEAYVHGKAAAI